MLSFELAQELKAAGFPQSTSPHAVYSLNDHLRIRREHAVQMWYGNKTKIGTPLELEEEAVFTPNLTELVVACGKPLDLACDKAGHWKAVRPGAPPVPKVKPTAESQNPALVASKDTGREEVDEGSEAEDEVESDDESLDDAAFVEERENTDVTEIIGDDSKKGT
jgi:hypothetical protein